MEAMTDVIDSTKDRAQQQARDRRKHQTSMLKIKLGLIKRDVEAGDLGAVLKGLAEARENLETLRRTKSGDVIHVALTVSPVLDALGRVIGTRRGVPEHNVIPRGGQTTFSLQLTPAGGPVSSFKVDALGRRLPTPTPPA